MEATTITTTMCMCTNFTYREASISFLLFELTMIYKICHDCRDMKKDNERWKLTIL